MRVGDDRRIEERPFGTRQNRRGDDHPPGRIAVAEIRVVRLAGEGVEAQRVVGHVEAGQTAVTVNHLRPDIGRSIELERAVVLSTALQQVLWPLRAG
jgi:hypothetical protein